jgi:hypothetical protein
MIRVSHNVEDNDASPWAGYLHHLRQRPWDIRDMLQQPRGAADVERAIREEKRLHIPDLKGDGNLKMEFVSAPPGSSDYGRTCVESHKTASRTDLHHVEHVGARAAANLSTPLIHVRSADHSGRSTQECRA